MTHRHAIAALLSVGLAACAGQQTIPSQEPGNSPAEVNVHLGVGYLERGQYEVALRKLHKALELNPNLPSAHTTIAVVYDQIGADDKAERHYRRAVELAPDDGMAQMNLATYLCKKGETAESEAHFLAALRDPFYKTPELAYTNAGICMARQGDLAKAESYLRRALNVAPSYSGALFKLSQVMYQRQDYLSARAFIQRFNSVAPATPGSLLLGVLIERKLGDMDAAAGYARMLGAQFPDSAEARQVAELAANE